MLQALKDHQQATQEALDLKDLPLVTQGARDHKDPPPDTLEAQDHKGQPHTQAAQDSQDRHIREVLDQLVTQVLPDLKVLRHHTPVPKEDQTTRGPKEVRGILQASPVGRASPREAAGGHKVTRDSPHNNPTENTSLQEIEHIRPFNDWI